MNIWIDNRSSLPIYDQVFTQIKNHILSGELQADEPLPSVRALAKDLRISVVTTRRAYEELEKEGLIYTVAAKGSFVAERGSGMQREDNLRKIEEHMSEILRLAALCGLKREELLEMLRFEMEEEQ
ncbi:MAG: GntR family transcriptional regulator [Clostridiales bacterium]|nr:GntR family transcriptional regulator [Candidatus Apopatocola equi]